MVEATVTSRIPKRTKDEAQKILSRNGTNSSRVINTLFARIVDEGSISFLVDEKHEEKTDDELLRRAVMFVDDIPIARKSEFGQMTKSEIKMKRLQDRGLL